MTLEPKIIDLSGHTQVGPQGVERADLQEPIDLGRLVQLQAEDGHLWVDLNGKPCGNGTYVVSILRPQDNSPAELTRYSCWLVKPIKVMKSGSQGGRACALDTISSSTHVHVALELFEPW